MTGVKIVGVKFLDVYSGCYACKGKVTAISDILGDCDRCGVTQKIEQCKMYNSARMDLESEGTIKTLSAFSPITEEICQGSVSKVSSLSPLMTQKPMSVADAEDGPLSPLMTQKSISFVDRLSFAEDGLLSPLMTQKPISVADAEDGLLSPRTTQKPISVADEVSFAEDGPLSPLPTQKPISVDV